jgi:DNA uptake protein ComE-like DNA-binding protein
MRTPIRRMRAARWLVLSGLLALSQVAAAGLVALEPVLVEGRVLMKAEPQGAYKAPVVRPLSGPLGPALAHEARTATTAFMLQLDAAAQRLLGQEHPQPTFLLVSAEEGSFARRGFWLMRGAGDPEWHADPYVNLAVDADSIEEGFAIHFQTLARELTRNPWLRLEDAGFAAKPFVPYWRDALDRTLRIRGVRDNLFVQRQLPWPAHPLAVSPDATPLFDPGELKNGQQMMTSEGVIATLFYHLLDQPSPSTAALRSRYTDLMRTLRAVDASAPDPGTAVFLRLVQEHIRLFPERRSAWLSTVIGMTYGATVDAHLARASGELALLGRAGDAEAFAARLAPARKALTECVEAVARDPNRLGAALGPELWTSAPQASASASQQGPTAADPTPAAVNLNTAERSSLILWLKLDAGIADLALASRAAEGPFKDLADFVQRAGLTAEREAQLRAGAAAILAAGPLARE